MPTDPKVHSLLECGLLRGHYVVITDDVVDFHLKQSQSEAGSLNQRDRIRQFSLCKYDEQTAQSEVARVASIPDLGALPPSQACPRPAVKFALTNATSAFDDLSQSRYEKL